IPKTTDYAPMLNNGYNNIDKDSYNVHNANYPYVLDIPASTAFEWCQENKRIDNAYSKYQSWVDNGCSTVDADWYKYPDTSLTYNK
ncbi:MAG: LruC domain-containing protein, partial [Prevotellaceae bacterium]|nr:LruC domain-containing protein [Prevotellaceae bacterium]